jgi:hypothetical protein
MKKYSIIVALIVALASSRFAIAAAGQDKPGKGATYATADQASYKEVVPGVSRAVLWGNPDKGPYGAFTKFKAGADTGCTRTRTTSGSS